MFQLEAPVSRLMQQLEDAGWLSDRWKVYVEADFCDADGNIYRPDRILSSDTETIVLDFKTGQPSTDYLEQVQNYCRLLKATGFPDVHGFLVYPASNFIQAVDRV